MRMTLRYLIRIVWTILFLDISIYPAESQLTAEKNRSVMLYGGKVSSEGNVLVSTERDPKGRALCDDFFGMPEANAICSELGFPRALRFTRGNFYGQDSHRWIPDGWKTLYYLNCGNSNDTNLQNCDLTDNRQDQCTQNEIAGVICQTDSIPADCPLNYFVCEDMQASNSSSSCIRNSFACDEDNDCSDGSDERPELCDNEGLFRLESAIPISLPENSVAGTIYMKYNQEWGTVCDDLFDKNDAKVICRRLGYGNGVSISYARAYFGSGEGDVAVDESKCSGQEETLSQCPGFIWGITDCTHIEDAGIFCIDSNLKVQLVGGNTPDSGRLEIIHGDSSSTAAICGSGFDDLDAQVVCRMLGYDSSQAVGLRGSPYGMGSGIVWNIILDCIGNESNIEECKMLISNNTCSHQDAAAVKCLRQIPTESLLEEVLPADCGQEVDSSDRFITSLGKVRGGIVPSRFDVPWLAALRYRTPTGYTHDCGAVIISDFYLLTAAHCFEEAGKLSYIVSVGEFNNNFDELTQQDYFIDKLYIHEHYEEIAFGGNDIALIKIEARNGRGMRLGDRVKAVCLPKIGDVYDTLQECSVTGWGRTVALGSVPTLPRTAKINGLSDAICHGNYGERGYTSSMSCFGVTDFINACRGDSGGPLTCQDSRRRHVLYGLVSVGRSCIPGALHPGIYTRITKYLRWIQESIYQDQRLG